MVLYASAEIPPSREGDLPVGFGSNVPGIPKDFQYPGGGKLQHIPDYHVGAGTGSSSNSNADKDTTQSISDQIHDALFKSDAPHRLPGFIFFLLILIIATFYLCGRDRRSRIYSSVFSGHSSPSAKPNPSFFSSWFRRRRGVGIGAGAGYDRDRDIEDGSARLYDPSDFELDNISSSSDDDRGGGGLGIDADAAFRKSNSRATASPDKSKRNPNLNFGRLTPDAIDRRGLVVRTESRESLGLDPAANTRSKSRNGSPTRLKT
jgi:hypothetical protein